MVLLKILASAVLIYCNILFGENVSIRKKTTYYPEYAHEVIRLLKNEVEKEYGFRCSGIGGSLPTDVRSLSIDFESEIEVTIEKAREIIVSISEKFLKIVNSNEDIRPFLRDWPFPVHRLNITIKFSNLKQKKIKNPEIAYCIKGFVYYCFYDEASHKFIDLYKETYEEALQIVKSGL